MEQQGTDMPLVGKHGRISRGALLMAALLAPMLSIAAADAQAQAQRPGSQPLGGLGSGKDPIKIDADRLDIFDKEKRATFTGNVVAVQGETTMRCSSLNVFYEQSATGNAAGAAPAPASGGPGGPGGNNNIRKLDCEGPVTVVSKDQTATGQHAVFDRDSNTVVLTGKVALSQGKNVQQCDRIVYNLDTSIANCVAKPGGRVQGVFVPGSGNPPK
ncbi:lipopolysaccharide export system protein LptA [Pseudochelatococcus lubricantis]|uniref:Lipopolysaccharide export system protein LptA n=1 Tax=Pseudochelatococcus lubricantis TaxID=1538102 RepID=A0ABX0UVK3_9HYPH|nr:LptA/OstA family protein [Pseudochelatococcus lubricantis]NIJ56988.1 lipopolysaccharide export system protein LptA [Pseudochelatococcus lubricantis]